MTNKKIKVIFDTNVWVSFLIGNFSKADFLVTGDKDLLAHNPFKTAQILTPVEFEQQIEK